MRAPAVPVPWLSSIHPEVSMSYALFIPDVNKPSKKQYSYLTQGGVFVQAKIFYRARSYQKQCSWNESDITGEHYRVRVNTAVTTRERVECMFIFILCFVSTLLTGGLAHPSAVLWPDIKTSNPLQSVDRLICWLLQWHSKRKCC